MNIFKIRTRTRLIHIVKKLECSYRVNKIKNLTRLKDINPFEHKKYAPSYKSREILKR